MEMSAGPTSASVVESTTVSDDPNRPDPDHELEVDINAFLPEGSRFATADDDLVAEEAVLDDGWDTGAPAPDIPAWARDGLPPVPAVSDTDPAAEVDGEVEGGVSKPGLAPVPNVGPAVPAPSAMPEVDTTVLTRVEGELADVDAAIVAIDAGDLARSPLLTELLATDHASPTPDEPPTNSPV